MIYAHAQKEKMVSYRKQVFAANTLIAYFPPKEWEFSINGYSDLYWQNETWLKSGVSSGSNLVYMSSEIGQVISELLSCSPLVHLFDWQLGPVGNTLDF